MNKLVKRKNGITLIALIITIVVLIILASVAITLSLGDNGIFKKAAKAKEDTQVAQNEEAMQIAETTNSIDEIAGSSRDTVTISKEEYDKLARKGYTLLWEGLANSATTYNFKESSYDVDNYDFISIEYYQANGTNYLYSSTMISKASIIKNYGENIALFGYGTRYTSLHFINNGFVIDSLNADSNCYEYATRIYGINL